MAKRKNTILSMHSILLMLDYSETVHASSVLRAAFIDDLATSVYADLARSGFDKAKIDSIVEEADELLGYDSTYDSMMAPAILVAIKTAAIHRFNAIK